MDCSKYIKTWELPRINEVLEFIEDRWWGLKGRSHQRLNQGLVTFGLHCRLLKHWEVFTFLTLFNLEIDSKRYLPSTQERLLALGVVSVGTCRILVLEQSSIHSDVISSQPRSPELNFLPLYQSHSHVRKSLPQNGRSNNNTARRRSFMYLFCP